MFAANSVRHQLNAVVLLCSRHDNIHAPGVVGEITLYTLSRGWHFICELCLGDKAKRGAVFWVISHQCSVGIDALVFPVG